MPLIQLCTSFSAYRDILCEAVALEDEKIEFVTRKATSLFVRGRNEIYFSPTEGVQDISEALILHLTAYNKSTDAQSPKLDTSERYVRNTANFLFNFLISNSKVDSFFDCVNQIADRASKLDVLEESFITAFSMLQRLNATRAEINRMKGRLEHTSRAIKTSAKWDDRFALSRVMDAADRAAGFLSTRLRVDQGRVGA